MNCEIYLYSKINHILEIATGISTNLNEIDKNYIVNKIKELCWYNIDLYYKKTSRQNLINLYFVLWKIIQKSNNPTIKNKFTFDEKIVQKINNGLQNMLWEFLEPDDIELS
jgi:hypothetical protein